VNDLQGSKVLANLADSIFAIGQSGIDAGIRYLKQLKSRSGEMLYDENHVPAFELKKRDGNFLGFVFRKFSGEAQHVKSATDAVRRERAETVAEMAQEGMSQRAIAAELGFSVASVNRYLHMAEPWSDERYNDDLFEDGPEEDVEPGPEVDLDALLRSKLESRHDTNMALRTSGGDRIGYYDIYDEIARKRWARDRVQDPLLYEKVLSEVTDEGKAILKEIEEPYDDDDDEDEDDEDAIDPGPDEVEEVEPQERDLPPGVERDEKGRLRKRTSWGWDYCAEAVGGG
jgi:DNA-directed RNA polymerase specialized sigma24 family protein